MIEYLRTLKCHQTEKTIIAELIADSKTDFEGEFVKIEDMPKGFELAMGSYCITTEGDLGIYTSSEAWSWLGSDPELSMVNLNLIKKAMEEKEEKG